jgi:hypothetical protein
MARVLPLLAVLLLACSAGSTGNPSPDQGADPASDEAAVPMDAEPDPDDPGADHAADLPADPASLDPAPDGAMDPAAGDDADDDAADHGEEPDGAEADGDAPDEEAPPACVDDPAACDDGNACTSDSCDPIEGCVHSPLTATACDDGDACTIGDACDDGKCVPGDPVSCDDSDPCTDDSCDGIEGCRHVLNAATCDDGNDCTTGDVCAAGVCAGTPAAIDCACGDTADCAVFATGNPCLGTFVCQGQVCVIDPSTVKVCDTSKDPPCQATACDPGTGGCVAKPLPDGSLCNDGDACTTGDRCAAGACAGGPPPDCGDGNACTTDTCNPATGCVHTNNTNPCAAAKCLGNVLYPAVSCASGSCPKQVAVTCTDGNACTTGDSCVDGACKPGAGFLDCDDSNPCTDDWCSPTNGCVSKDNSAVCAPAKCVGLVHYSESACAVASCPKQTLTDCSGTTACVVYSCDAATGCSQAVASGKCLIDGACHSEGDPSPATPCMECRPSSSVSGWSLVADGTACGAGMACVQGTCRGPMITEFMALNHDTLKDEDGESSDWIELYNPTPATISLAGYHLTDDPAKPGKWTLPAVSIAPESYLVVFASGKNRIDPAGELHTSFKLAGEGEHLALTGPDLKLVQEFASFPPQAPDVSYGVAVTVVKSPLVVSGAPARYRVPSGTSPPAGWTAVGFDDTGPQWAPAVTGIGFDTTQGYETPATGEQLGAPVADSVADWSVTGVQGEKGWTYGYWNRTTDADHVYSADAFVPFPRDGSGYGPTDYWNGAMYDWYPGNPPWTSIGQEYVHPAGANNGAEHWPIRRYRADVAGPLFVEWSLAKSDPNGDGVTGYVFLRGALVDSVAIAGADTAGIVRSLVLADAVVGDPIDFALGPAAPGGQQQDTSDGSLMSAAIWRLPHLADEVATDIGAAMSGLYPGLYVRVPFDKEVQGPINRLWLRMKYDDGFAAWLNGTLVAVSNAPTALDWDSTATVNRSVTAAVAFEDFDARAFASLLTAGGGVLAIQGLNASTSDPTFLVLPELEGRLVTYDPGTVRYYGRPTPGADNDEGAGMSGPIVEHLTPQGSVAPGQAVTVTARLFPTGAAVASASVYYRVMFGPEVPIAMAAGAGGVYTAAIPAGVALPGQMIRWYVVATDTAGHGTRLPPYPDPLDSEQYYGTMVGDPTVVSNLPVFHWFVENLTAAGTWAGTRCSLFFGGEFYDNIRFDLHGQSTAGFPKKSYDVDFNSDHRFKLSADYKRMKDINLLTNWADKSKLRNTLAYETFRDAGTGYHLAFPVRIQKNGAFFSVADFVEDADDRWLERLGLDPEGALYKQYDGLYDAAKGEKKTRKSEDHSDLAALIAGLDKTGDDLRNFIFDNVRIPAMVDFLAGLIITADMDCCHKNFYAYRDTNASGEWWYLPWDVDLTFGRNWIKSLTYFDDTMHPQNGLYVGGNNKLIAPLFAMPEFKEMYVRRIRTLMDAIQQAPGTPAADLKYEKRIDELVAQIGADGALDYAAWPKWGLDQTMEQAASIMKNEYMAPRRVFLFETKTADGTIPAAQANPTVLFGAFDASPGNPDQAWLTLANPNAFSVDVSGWQVTGDISITLPPGTVLAASGTVYLSPNVVAFRARPLPPTGGQGLMVLGSYTGTLADVATLVLLDENGVPVPQLP